MSNILNGKWKFLSITVIGILATSLLAVAFQLPQQLQDTLFAEQVNAPFGLPSAYGAGALTKVFALPSNNVFRATGYYNIVFTTATTGTIKTIEITFPAGFNVGSTKLLQTQGTGAGSLSVSGQVVKYTITTPVSVTAPKAMTIMIASIVNPAITSNQVSVVTKDASNVVIDGPTNSATFSLTQVTNSMIASNSITTAKILDGQVMTSDLANNAVSLAKLAADAVNSAKIVDGTIQLVDLAANSVDSSKIVDGSVRPLDLAPIPNSFSRPDAGNAGYYLSMAIGTDGLPVISYFDNTNADLKVLRCGIEGCS